MTTQFVEFSYLFSAVCFILALKGLSSPKTARFGNIIAVSGMLVALYACFSAPQFSYKIALLITVIAGGVVGGIIARKIQMTAMPQLVAGFHSLVGLAAVLVAFAALLAPDNFGIGEKGVIAAGALIEMSLGASIGALTFSGSLIAFGKLQGILGAKPIKFYAQQYICLALTIFLLFLIYYFAMHQSVFVFTVMVLLSFVVGVLLIIPIGGADMPVVVSMLNSYSGWAAAGIGFTLSNSLLVITGALVGTSGAILSYVMCKAMNRSLFNVIFGAFLKQTSAAAQDDDDRVAKVSSPEDAAYMLEKSDSVIIVPGYGMAVAQSQHAIKELTEHLKKHGVTVRFAIHPVAGRMPGHMNVLLAEANIDYNDVLELEEINSDFKSTDVVLVIGANDVTNPAAKTDKTSPIYGMPVLDVGAAKTVLFIKRSMSSGYAGIPNELFYNDNTLMLFGDAKKVVEDIVKAFGE
ncbi:MAG: NAD(P)(+) transhydrogenase (Re/Si-specific) subunit beta [Rickettsiales bacterium]|nr:NAD(P)(+) transhydrogenase (Re/Si-specific) subunit beta [Rickettsiales bacterium]MCA0254721.1 NAD(P)(+) transhydrogenase (Re/Si-specific) subunit beta [Pseudomonadota bacterium]